MDLSGLGTSQWPTRVISKQTTNSNLKDIWTKNIFTDKFSNRFWSPLEDLGARGPREETLMDLYRDSEAISSCCSV